MNIRISHLPTMLLVIGSPVYWLELYVFQLGRGRASLLAPILFFLFSAFVFWQQRQSLIQTTRVFLTQWRAWHWWQKCFVCCSLLGILALAGMGLNAALLPLHLCQEFDALNYHMTLPRQHLITGSFQLIRWTAEDLYLLPVQFGLAPYWFSTSLPNKIPQFIFFIGLLVVTGSLINKISKGDYLAVFAGVAGVCGLQVVGIQTGMGMLDLVLCYLFLAAVDSFLDKRVFLSAVESIFCFWAKSFYPVQFSLLFLGAWLAWEILKRLGWQMTISLNEGQQSVTSFEAKPVRKYILYFIVLSALVAGPFIVKNIYYAGTPLFPFAVGMLDFQQPIRQDPVLWPSLLSKVETCLHIKDGYGYGRSPWAFIKHLWLLAVPEDGVNNSYDYPVGLSYLLFLAPFIFGNLRYFLNKKISMLSLAAVMLWGIWWMGSHQSRFLIIPLVLMAIVVSSENRYLRPSLLAGLLLAVLFVNISVLRANKADWGKKPYEVLRPQDKKLLEMSREQFRHPQLIDFSDAVFAEFEIDVVGSGWPFVMKH